MCHHQRNHTSSLPRSLPSSFPLGLFVLSQLQHVLHHSRAYLPALGDSMILWRLQHVSRQQQQREGGADPVQPITISVSFLYLYLAICGSQLDLRAVVRRR